ncbi:MAG: UDP-N-acetylmuramoyl-tripeptide--D-alanyl-D-alanine ligase [Candidatus Paceibacteria bacterium]|jgi:UDP-N-acetylmuramoyl-tripeptide--D-alanyl-D-alanine ligase
MEEIYNALKDNNFEFTTDTRTMASGKAFFAIAGDNFDGNDFVLKAIENGAPFAVSNRKDLSDTNENVFYSENTTKLFRDLAEHHRNIFDIPVIAITGSNGKTTTKELIRSVLSKKYNVLATEGNFNNHLGTPFTLLKITKETEVVILEIGANHLGEIGYLCNMSHPTHGIITNIGEAHLEGFGGVEGVKKAKGELYDYLKNSGCTVYFDNADKTLVSMLEDRELLGSPYIDVLDVDLKLFGSYNMQNARAAYTVGVDFGVEKGLIVEALEMYEEKSDRSRVYTTKNGNKIVADMYNANPTSINLALEQFLSEESEQDKIVILGDMLELGEYSHEAHKKIIKQLENSVIENVYLVGKEFLSVGGPFKNYSTTLDLIKTLKDSGFREKYIFIKGSRGLRLENILKQEVL